MANIKTLRKRAMDTKVVFDSQLDDDIQLNGTELLWCFLHFFVEMHSTALAYPERELGGLNPH